MAENFRETFVNPYVDEKSDEARFSTFVTMDEAHERWNNGTWHGDKTGFALDPSMFSDSRGLKLDSDGKSADKPRPNRFAFDLRRDIIDADQASSNLDENAYTSNYRPSGSIGSNLSSITIDRLRYNALADIREELPEDLSYLYGEGDGSTFRKRRVKLRSYERLNTPIDRRRAELEKMLPETNTETPEAIMADIRRRQDIEDAKSGFDRRSVKPAPRRGFYDIPPSERIDEDYYTAEDQYDIEGLTERGSWRNSIPEQDGLVPDSRALPYFGRFSRSWSKIDSTDPSRTEMLRHTVNTIYDEPAKEHDGSRFRQGGNSREYYVADSRFDPENRYRRMERPRRRVSASRNVLSESINSGDFNNPYVQVSNQRLRDIINHDMRGPGHLAEPEGLSDPALMYEWNMGYSRVNTDENRYSEWLDQQSMLAEQAEQSRYRGSHRTGRPGAYIQREKPYGEERKYPRGSRTEHEKRRRDRQEELQRATEKGIADGREIVRLQQKAAREAEQRRIRRMEEDRRRAYEQQMKAYEQQMKAYRQHIKAYEKQNRAAPGAEKTGTPSPEYGPMGYYTPQPQTGDRAPSDRRVRKPSDRSGK